MDEQEIFAQALERTEPAARAAFLDRACGCDTPMRRRVERLLELHQQAGSFLEHPPVERLFAERVEAADDREREPPTEQPTLPSGPDAAAADGGPAPGTRVRYVGDYELLEEIGRGGMGVVYKARQVSLNRIVALKMIVAGQLASQAEIERFHTEAQAAAQLQHPNIVPVHEVGQYEGQQYFSMDYVEGPSLAELLRAGPWPAREAAQLVKTLADAVEHAHQHGILHRDLKPSNVLLKRGTGILPVNETSRGMPVDVPRSSTGWKPIPREPAITDFGLAKRIEAAVDQPVAGEAGSRPELTATGQVLGTPGYMAPEQAAGAKRGKLGPPTDVYSLGTILYELLTGRPPFQAATPVDTILQSLDQEPVPPHQLNRTIPRDLETICLKCLEKEPYRRYRTAAQLSNDLARFLSGQPITARRATRLERIVKWTLRRPALAALVAVSVAAVLVLTIGGIGFTWRLGQQRDYAQQQLWRSRYEQARAERLAGNRRRAMELLGAAAHTRQTPELRREAVQAIVSAGLELRHELVIGHACSVQFSPDGSLLAVHGKYGYGPAWSTGDPPEQSVSLLGFWELPSGRRVRQVPLALPATNLELGMTSFSPVSISQYAPFALSPVAGAFAVGRRATDTIEFWELRRGKPLVTIKGDPRGPVVFNRDGTLAAMIRQTGPVTTQIVQVERGTLIGPAIAGQPIAFVADDQLLVLNSRNRKLQRVNYRSGEVAFSTPDDFWPLAVSANGQTAVLAKSSRSGTPVEIWDMMAEHPLITLAEVGGATHYREAYELQFSPDGSRLAFQQVSSPNTIRIWDRSANAVIRTVPGTVYAGMGRRLWVNWNQYQTAVFSPHGRLLVAYAGAGTNRLQVWDVDNHTRCGLLPGNHSPRWSPDGRWLATIAGGQVTRPDGTTDGEDRKFVHVWEVSYPPPQSAVAAAVDWLCFGPSGRGLAVNDRPFDLIGPWLRPALRSAKQQGLAEMIVFDKEGRRVAIGFPTNALSPKPGEVFVRIVEQKDLVLTQPRTPNLSEIPNQQLPAAAEFLGWTSQRNEVAVDASADVLAMFCQPWWQRLGQQGAASGMYGCLAVWRLAEGQTKPAWQRFPVQEPVALSIAPGGRILAVAGNSGLQLWDVTTGQQIHHVRAAKTWTSPDKLEHGWNRRSKVNGRYHYVKYFGVKAIAFGPDGRLVYAATEGGRVYVYDVANGRQRACWQVRPHDLMSLAVSPDGTIVACGSAQGAVMLLDAHTGNEHAYWEVHVNRVTAVAFSPDGHWLASGSSAGAVKLWDVARIRKQLSALGIPW